MNGDLGKRKKIALLHKICLLGLIYSVFINTECFLDILDIFVTNVPEVVSLWVTLKVVIELVEEHTSNQLCILCQGQLVWQLRNLATNLEDLFQT